MFQKRILFIAFHFPPLLGSSGLLRTLKFVKYLPDFNFKPLVLTAHPRSYHKTDFNLIHQIPRDVYVKRAFALNTQKHLTINGKYLELFALPDQYVSWIFGGIISGLILIIKRRVDIIYSTYPIASAHVIGFMLHLLTRKPWIADFRDPMKDEFIPMSRSKFKVRSIIEKFTLKYSTHILVTTNNMKKLYLALFPEFEKKISVVMNGYDEEDFKVLEAGNIKNKRPIRLIHAGLLDLLDRDPIPFFEAIRNLLIQEEFLDGDFIVELYSPGYNDLYNEKINHLKLQNVIKILPPVSYEEILKIMTNSHILLLFQGPTCDTVIPAKIFEYFRIGRPIFALTSEEGETGRLLKKINGGEVVPIHDSEQIADALSRWINAIKADRKLPVAKRVDVLPYSRMKQTGLLAHILNNLK
ncbi:MAG: hypothetical protein JXL67_11050 [Calditrichaeota bacterium]|nr:hypothetical protein [Calditrichota bacterium]